MVKGEAGNGGEGGKGGGGGWCGRRRCKQHRSMIRVPVVTHLLLFQECNGYWNDWTTQYP